VKDDDIRAIVRQTLDVAIEPVRKAFADLRSRLTAIEQRLGMYASDEDLDGPHGNEKVRFSPKQFRGPNYLGKKMSECSLEFLDALAEALQFSADNAAPEKAKYVPMNRRSAARARAWARRIRSGVSPPPAAARAIANGVAAPEAISAPDVDAPQVEAPQIDEPSFDEPSDADENAELPTF